MSPSLDPGLTTLEGRIGRITKIIDDMKGERIVALDLRDISDFADAFVIATARSRTQMHAIIGKVLEQLRNGGLRAISKTDHDDQRWALIDYGDVVVHIFEPEAREYYDLEGLWGDADELPWQQLAMA